MRNRCFNADEIVAPGVAASVFSEFMNAMPPWAVENAYGRRFPRPLLRFGDRLFVYHGNGARVAWGRITPHPEEAAVFVGLGVWPEHARLGWREDVRAHLAHVAFHDYPEFRVQRAIVGVLATNIEHWARCLRESANGGPWRYSGVVWHPEPACHMFTLERGDFGRLIGL